MKKNKIKVLVLIDLQTNFEEVVNYTAKLAKTINADYEFFTVKKPTEIVNTDSQLSAIRSINRDGIQINNEIKTIASTFAKHSSSNVKTSFAIGNVKAEIENKINTLNPDLVILGKRKPKAFNFIGDNMAQTLLKKCDTTVLVVSEKSTLKILNDVPLHLVSRNNEELVL